MYLKKIIGLFLIPLTRNYLSKDRNWRYKDTSVRVLAGVFHPGLFFSTKILLQFIEKEDLINRTFLELGAGTGIISVLAAQKKAKVWASDLSLRAIENIEINVHINQVTIQILHSDLFDKFPTLKFDSIVINPPYYPRKATNEAEYAWCCGENFEYFERLFRQLAAFIHSESKVWMILSEDCKISKIKEIAQSNRFSFQLVLEKRVWGEKNYLFRIIHEQSLAF